MPMTTQFTACVNRRIFVWLTPAPAFESLLWKKNFFGHFRPFYASPHNLGWKLIYISQNGLYYVQ